jgi:FAD:protein FMN transferase
MRAERSFRAMGSDARVVVNGDESLLDLAQDRVEDLESRWSRFRVDSELTRLNQAAGRPTVVSPETVLLVTRCIEGWIATAGAFDPTVHDAVVELGYDRDFLVLARGATRRARHASGAPGLAGVVVDADAGLVWLPAGIHLDPGAIGKGLAADLVCRELVDAGAGGACVALGGDVRVTGRAPERDAWVVSIEDPHDTTRELARIDLSDGGVATSSRLRRRWRCDGVDVHHVIDPRTGDPADTATVAVTAVAHDAWWAEVRATAALLSPDPLADPGDVELLTVDDDGSVRSTAAFTEVLACSQP